MPGLKFKRLHPAAKLPTKAHAGDAGWDLYAPEEAHLHAGKPIVVPLGIAWEGPPGWYAQLVGRSGLAARGVAVLGGVVDTSYRGEWKAVLVNTFRAGIQTLQPGDRICQFVLHKVPPADVLDLLDLAPSERGSGGFGSTGA